jgi:N,N-dimethylformamidase beta subunit-like, C-terminal
MRATARHLLLALIACTLVALGAAAAPLTHPTHGVVRNDTMTMAGDPVSGIRQLGTTNPGRETRIRLGEWTTGFYYAQLADARGRVGYAPFVLRPRRLGEHRVAVVFPTQTWEAYNRRDDGGTPHHYRNYEEPFLRWLIEGHHDVDYLSDRELKEVRSGAALARHYDLIIFEGHHEYVTTHEYDVVTDYRDRGGNLMFLAANNLFCRIDIEGSTMHRIDTWRNLGRPEAALVGVQYIGWNQMKFGGEPYVLRYPASAAWIFEGTGLKPGDDFGYGGIEIDHRADSSPRGLSVLATIPDVFGKGFTAEMSYYETPTGAKVFAAGAFSLGGSIGQPQMAPVVTNVWTRLAQEG